MAYLVDGRPFKYFPLEEVVNTKTKKDIKCEFNWKLTRQGNMMDDLREWYGGPLNVSSWFREKDFNDGLPGSSPNSCHLQGVATDIINIPWTRFKECEAMWRFLCKKYNVIGGIGLYDWGMHFDSNDDPNRYGKFNDKFRVTDFR